MLFFCGDVNLTDWDFNFGFGIGSRIVRGFNPFEKIIRLEDDIWVGNFEGVASSATIRRGMAAEVFRVEPGTILPLRHLNYYGFANNHAMQHGAEAYRQTVETLAQTGCGIFGTKNQKSIFFIHQSRKVSLTGACFRIDEFTEQPLYWYNPEYSNIKDEIDSLPKDAFKVFFVHWGNEYINRPSVQQRRFAHWLIDAGFDLIIGMHPHVIQGYEEYKGKRIYYSLGNFVFDMVWEPCRYGAVISVDLKGEKPSFHDEYVYIDETCAPQIVEKEKVPKEYRFDYLNEQLKKEENSEEYHTEIRRRYKAYSKANRKNVLRNIVRHPQFGADVMRDFIRRRVKH